MSMQRSGGDDGEFLEVQLDDGIGEHLRVLAGVPLRYVDDVRLQNHRVDVPFAADELVDRRHGPVVVEPVLAADDSEAENVPLVVQNLQPLHARRRRQPRHDSHLPHAPHPDGGAAAVIIAPHVAALYEVLVLLWAVEAADQGPHRLGRGLDPLGYQGRASVGRIRRRIEVVVRRNHGFQLGVFLRS